MANTDDWSADANEAVEVSLWQPYPEQPTKVHRFHPKFTYPIFGEEERVFGYKGLAVDLRYTAHDLQPNVAISYDKKFTTVGSTVALDLNKTLKDFLPLSAFTSSSDFNKAIQDTSATQAFRPPGELVTSYTRKHRSFEIWAGSLLDPHIRNLIDRIQIFVLLFIEAGTYIKTDDVDWTLERWKIYFLYEVTKPSIRTASPYVLAGYATTYRFYRFQMSLKTEDTSAFPVLEKVTPTQLPSVLRISQFLILPPFQSSGHGSQLYQTIYGNVLADSTIAELSVEDPSEEFDKLRDINDWKVLESQFTEAGIKINTSPYAANGRSKKKLLPTGHLLPVDILREIRTSTKIASRQFARQLEMYLLSLIPHSHRAAGGASITKLVVQKAKTPDPHDKAYYWWRLIVKQRITKKNRDQLQQLDLADRIPRVDESARAQEDEYEGLLLYMVTMQAKELMRNGEGVIEPAAPRKRKIVDDDDDVEMEGATPPEKRSRPT